MFWLALFNCLIGFCFWAGQGKESIWADFLVANCIGFSAYLYTILARRFLPGRAGLLLRIFIIAPLSVLTGIEIAALLAGHALPLQAFVSSAGLLHLLPTFFVAAITTAFVSVVYQSAQMRAVLETQRREAAELRQSETAARLAMLQAQIEPHFLFNTLANVQSLISREPDRAVLMLDNLNRYLRASLGRTRKPESLLNEELELVDALLQIAAIRLGERLQYRVEVADALRLWVLPPLLLQPLVENALLHGIEPAINGGSIVIRAAMVGDALELAVIDTGIGLGNSTRLHSGVGLANVRARLKAIYADRASLTISANAGQGTTASLLIPRT